MEESKAEKWEVERIGFWLHGREANLRQVARRGQASTRAEHLWAMGNTLVKLEDRERTAHNLPEAYQNVLKIHKGLWKAASLLIVQMRTEKIGLKNFYTPGRYQALTH